MLEVDTQKAEEARTEKNRAAVATLNSEVRRSKAAIRAEIPKLQKLAAKKVHSLSFLFHVSDCDCVCDDFAAEQVAC